MNAINLKNNKMEKQSKKYSSYYVNRFISMKCSADLLGHKLFPNAKEITESFGGLYALKHLNLGFGDKVTAVCVGDGHTPRTAALLAHLTNWECISVDPLLRNKSSWSTIRNLTIHSKYMEQVYIERTNPVVLLEIHSHCRLSSCLSQIYGSERHIIAIPCCVPLSIKNRQADLEYRDDNIWSPCNLIKVFKNV